MRVHIGKFPKKENSRKINVKIDTYDTWSLDHTLALVIYPALLQLKATKQGVPGEFVNDNQDGVQEAFDFYEEDADEMYKLGLQRWDDTLDHMIWAFGQLLKDDYEEKYHHGTPEFDLVVSDKQFPNPITGKIENTYQMVDTNPDEHWFDSEGQLKHEQRIQEGLELFGKHFRSLWD